MLLLLTRRTQGVAPLLPKLYPLAGQSQGYPLAGQSQTYPLAGQPQN
jgi:hypothetical protein